MTIHPDAVMALCMVVAGIASWVSWYVAERRQRPARAAEAADRAEKDAERARRDALIYDEIVGHKDMPGVPDKKPMAQRLEIVEAMIRSAVRELHPNGGSSLADTINATHKLAAQAADHSIRLAEDLEAANDALESHTRQDESRFTYLDTLLGHIRTAVESNDVRALTEALDQFDKIQKEKHLP